MVGGKVGGVVAGVSGRGVVGGTVGGVVARVSGEGW